MSNETFVLSTVYMLSAINAQGQRVYYEQGDAAGQILYWQESNMIRTTRGKTDNILIRTTWPDLACVPHFPADHAMHKGMDKIQVLEVQIQARVLPPADLAARARAVAAAKIAQIQKELDQEINQLCHNSN
jgi:hypothetical protein